MIPSSTEARAYLAQHGVIDRLQAEVAKVLKDRPADPIVAIGKALAKNGSLISAPRSPQRSGGSKPSTPTKPKPTAVDEFGCPIADRTAAAVPGIVEYHRCVLAYARFEAWGAIVTTAEAHPGSAMAALLAADFLQQQAGGSGPAGNDQLDAAAAALGGGDSPHQDERCPPAREGGYLKALRATALGDFLGAYAAWFEVVRAHPADLFAVKRGQFTCIMTGRSAQLLEIAEASTPPSSGALGRYYDGLLAFGLEQTADLAGAEAAARRGLEREAAAAAAAADAYASSSSSSSSSAFEEDGWLQHGLAHALYFQARPAEAIDFLSARSSRWRREAWHPFLFTHLWWHLALLHAEEGHADAALQIYDDVLWTGADAGEMEVQLNAIGLLVRLHVRGVQGLAPRWEAVLDGIAKEGPSAYIHAYPLHNLLRLVALLVCGRDATELVDGLRTAAEEAKDSNPSLGDVVLPLAAALVSLLGKGGDALFSSDAFSAEAKASILKLRGESGWASVAGSEEQRGFLLELAAGPVRAGKPVAESGGAPRAAAAKDVSDAWHDV